MSDRLDQLAAEMKRIEGAIINESEAERKRQAVAFQRQLAQEKEAAAREQEESKARTEEWQREKEARDRASDEAERQRYTAYVNYLASILPPADQMPKCEGCGARLSFFSVGELPEPPEIFERHDFLNTSPYGVVLLHCPRGCGSQLARFQSELFPLRFD